MERKLLKRYMLLARYQDAIDGAQLAMIELDRATLARDAIRRELLTLVSEAELADVMGEEPTDVENPAHG